MAFGNKLFDYSITGIFVELFYFTQIIKDLKHS